MRAYDDTPAMVGMRCALIALSIIYLVLLPLAGVVYLIGALISAW